MLMTIDAALRKIRIQRSLHRVGHVMCNRYISRCAGIGSYEVLTLRSVVGPGYFQRKSR